jgi:hypothetical protein
MTAIISADNMDDCARRICPSVLCGLLATWICANLASCAWTSQNHIFNLVGLGTRLRMLAEHTTGAPVRGLFQTEESLYSGPTLRSSKELTDLVLSGKS